MKIGYISIFLLCFSAPAYTQAPINGGIDILPKDLQLSFKVFTDKLSPGSDISIDGVTWYEAEQIVQVHFALNDYVLRRGKNCIETNVSASNYYSYWMIEGFSYLYWRNVESCENLDRENAIDLFNFIDDVTLEKVISGFSALITMSNTNPMIQLDPYEKVPENCKLGSIGITDDPKLGLIYQASTNQACEGFLHVWFEIIDGKFNVLRAGTNTRIYE